MSRPQKDLNHNRIDKYAITEYEENFIPTPTGGPWESDDQFDSYHRFDFFSEETVRKSINEFIQLVSSANLPSLHYQQIEQGIKAYTNSSTTPTKEQALLIKSILDWQPDILTEKFFNSGEDVQQVVGEKYFMNYDFLNQFKFSATSLIPAKSLDIYIKCAEAITLKRLNEWVEFSKEKDGDSAWAPHFDRIMVFRGINNSKYYTRKQKKGDLLSIYTGVAENESAPFFERALLTSYTISPNLAEQFMVGSDENKSQRRITIEGNTDLIEGRIFSSFLISPNFRPRQFEFICLPDTKHLRVKIDFSNEIHASFIVHD